MTTYRELSRFVLSRGLMLATLLLAGALALHLCARQGGSPFLFWYADQFEVAARVAFGCGTCGSVLMEDMLRYFGE